MLTMTERCPFGSCEVELPFEATVVSSPVGAEEEAEGTPKAFVLAKTESFPFGSSEAELAFKATVVPSPAGAKEKPEKKNLRTL